MSYVPRALALFVATLSATSPVAAADERRGQAEARAAIVEPMVVRMQWAAAMPSVRGSVDGAVFMGTMPSMAMGMMMPANARLIMRREDETGEPVTAPAAFEVVTGRRADTVVVRTGVNADIQLSEGSVVSGVLPGRSAASVDVARGLILAAAGGRAPHGAGTLVVMVQYN